jgi:hypothetical protein
LQTTLGVNNFPGNNRVSRYYYTILSNSTPGIFLERADRLGDSYRCDTLSLNRLTFENSFSDLCACVDSGTAFVTTDNVSPVGLHWYTATRFERTGMNGKQGIDLEVSTKFICKVCNNETNPCLFDGICLVDGACRCSMGSKGDLCEINPVGNGHCDNYFNTIRYEYDGGDCCESTCTALEAFSCGMADGGYTNQGFFSCLLPGDDFHLGRFHIHVDDTGPAPSSQMMLNQNGQVLIFSGSMDDIPGVHIYDKRGPSWVLRETLNDFGNVNRVAIGMGQHYAFSNPSFVVPFVVAVNHAEGTGLNIYECDGSYSGCVALEIPRQYTIESSRFEDVAVSGDSLVAAAVTTNNTVVIFELFSGSALVQRASLEPFSKVHAISLSRNGEVLALMVCTLPEGRDGVCGDLIVMIYTWDGRSYGHSSTIGTEIYLEWPLTLYFKSDELERGSFGLELSQDGLVMAVWVLNCAASLGRISVVEWQTRKFREFPPIEVEQCEEEACAGDNDCINNYKKFGAFALSADGSVLAFRFGEDVAHVMEWSGAWKPVGSPLASTNAGGIGLAMSPDGLIVSASAPGAGPLGEEVVTYSLPRRGCGDGKFQCE